MSLLLYISLWHFLRSVVTFITVAKKVTTPTPPPPIGFREEAVYYLVKSAFSNRRLQYSNRGLRYCNHGLRYCNNGVWYCNRGVGYSNRGVGNSNRGLWYFNRGLRYFNRGLQVVVVVVVVMVVVVVCTLVQQTSGPNTKITDWNCDTDTETWTATRDNGQAQQLGSAGYPSASVSI